MIFNGTNKVIEMMIDGERYITRAEIPNYTTMSYFDTQRFLERYKAEITGYLKSKIIHYKYADIIKQAERDNKLKQLREEVIAKCKNAKDLV